MYVRSFLGGPIGAVPIEIGAATAACLRIAWVKGNLPWARPGRCRVVRRRRRSVLLGDAQAGLVSWPGSPPAPFLFRHFLRADRFFFFAQLRLDLCFAEETWAPRAWAVARVTAPVEAPTLATRTIARMRLALNGFTDINRPRPTPGAHPGFPERQWVGSGFRTDQAELRRPDDVLEPVEKGEHLLGLPAVALPLVAVPGEDLDLLKPRETSKRGDV